MLTKHRAAKGTVTRSYMKIEEQVRLGVESTAKYLRGKLRRQRVAQRKVA